jgi:capsular polysaccharide biosynthesis protein
MTFAPRPDTLELADYLGVLRRRWWIVVLLAGIGLIGAGAYVKAAPKAYTATASVYVSATAANNNQALGRTSGPVNMDNEAQIAQSQTVAALAARQLNTSLTPQELVKRVSVAVPPNTTVLDISCTQPTRHEAQACANDFASAYLTNRLATSTDTISSAVQALQAKENRLIAKLSRLKARIHSLSPTSAARATSEMQHDATVGELAQVESQVSDLVPELASMQAAHNTLAGHVITPAVRPASPSSPRKMLLLPSGLLAGLLIGLLAAFIAERRDKRVHTAVEVERYLDLPVLLNILPHRAGMKAEIAAARSGTGMAFTDLAKHLAASLGNGRHIVLVATTARGPSGSMVTANLAAALARTRSRVLLVCPDLRGTAMARLLGLDDTGRGLSDVLAGRATVKDVTRRPSGIPGLGVVLPGSGSAADLCNVQHEVLRRVASELRTDARYVIVEAPVDGFDAFALAEFADAAILAVEVDGTSRPDAAGCIRRLEQLRTAVLGAAVVPRLRDRTQVRPRPPAQFGDREILVIDSARQRRDLPESRSPAMLEQAAGSGAELAGGAAASLRSGETWPLPRVPGPEAGDRPRDPGQSAESAGEVAGAERHS